MVSLRKSRKQALLAAAAAGTHRRSARLVELEEKKRLEEAARAAAVAAAAAALADTGQPPNISGGQVTGRKRGRKKKHVDEITVTSVYEEGQSSQWQAGPSFAGSSSGYYTAGSPLPSKRTLESVLDVLQMMDSENSLAMPPTFEEESVLEGNLRMPQDFGTVRAKLHEGYYTTFEHFESDVFSVISTAKHPNPLDPALYKLASALEHKAEEVFRALRTQPGFELYVLNWAASNRKTTGQLRIGCGSGAAGGATLSSSLHMAPAGGVGCSGVGDGSELASRAAPRGRPFPAGGSRGLRRAARARGAAGARRCRRRTLGVSDVHARLDRHPQRLPEDRRSSYARRGRPEDVYDMMRDPPPLVRDIEVCSEISYEESLMRFASAGGAVVERIARQVLEEQRTAATKSLEERNQLPPAPSDAQRNPPPVQHNNNVDLTAAPAPHLSCTYSSGRPPTQGSALSLGNTSEAAGRQLPIVYDLTLDEPEPAILTPTCGFSFPPPSIIASPAGMPGLGTSHSYWPASDMGSSSAAAAAGYNFYFDTASVAPGSTLVGRDGPAPRDSSAGEGTSSADFLFGPRRLNYMPLFTTASTSTAPVYQPPAPAPAPPADMSDFLQLGSCNKIAGSSSTQQLPADPVDGFQYLLSLDIGPSGVVTSTDVSGWQVLPDGKGKAPMEPQPEPNSQAVFDLKLLQSRLGENPWGKNGISALRAPWAYTAMHSDYPSSMQAGPSSTRNAELSTLDLLGARNPDLNLNL